MKILGRFIWFLVLTVITQVGGLIYLLNLGIHRFAWKPKNRKWLKRQFSFIVLYVSICLMIVPPLARLHHRQPLPWYKVTSLQPQNWFTIACNRHYVHTNLYSVITQVADDFSTTSAHNGAPLILNYLDANFPFLDGFPLIPHLSHNDGKKLDLAFRYYSKDKHLPMNQTVSLLGYGVYVRPSPGEIDQTTICKQSRWQYDITKYMGIPIHDNMIYDGGETKRLMTLLAEADIKKIFIEPHLKNRMGINSDKIRFHGCHAVRHDDHIHVQVR
jgi:hypothetical protein